VNTPTLLISIGDGQDLQIKEKNKTTETTAMITITKTIMGTTIIALPNFMFKMGMGLGSVLLIVNGIIGVLVIGVLLRCKDITKKL
jgi:amino acid permease